MLRHEIEIFRPHSNFFQGAWEVTIYALWASAALTAFVSVTLVVIPILIVLAWIVGGIMFWRHEYAGMSEKQAALWKRYNKELPQEVKDSVPHITREDVTDMTDGQAQAVYQRLGSAVDRHNTQKELLRGQTFHDNFVKPLDELIASKESENKQLRSMQ